MCMGMPMHTHTYPELYKILVNTHNVPGTELGIEGIMMTKAVSHLALHIRHLLK